MTRCLFVTGSGTGVGKTYVTAGLIRALRRAGRTVDAIKPVASGFDPARPNDSDAGMLLAALGGAGTIGAISPWRFAAPLSPDRAAAQEGRAIDFDTLIARCRERGATDVFLVEGVGGVMVPLTLRHTVLDWMAELGWPALIVCGSYLGAISHALTAYEAVRMRGIGVRALVVNASDGDVGVMETITAVTSFVSVPVHGLARDGGDRMFDELAARIV